LFAGRQQSIDSQEDCRRKLETLEMQSDSNRFARRADRDNKMTIESRRYVGRKNLDLWSQKYIDEELADIKKEIENLALRMQQKAKSRWVYEWPMKKPKINWSVKELKARRQHKLLKGWLSYPKNLDGPKEMVQVCEPETGRTLDEEDKMGSAEDLKKFQEGREEILVF
jgi:hypothetical protein